MRLSVSKNDPGYCPHAHMCFVELNGKKVNGCITIDEKKKCVWKYSNKAHFVNGEWEWSTEKVKGNFKIVFPVDWVFSVKYHKKKRLRKKINKMIRR